MLFYTILIAAIMAIIFAQEAHIFDYSKMPSCARRCDILQRVELNCVRNYATNLPGALACVCTSSELHLLHFGDYPCAPVCNAEESDSIHLYYNNLCKWKAPILSDIGAPTATTLKPSSPSTSPPATTSPPTTLSTVPNGPTGTMGPPSPSLPSTKVDDKAEVHGTWASDHTKYLIIAGAMVGATLAALLLAVFTHRRRQKAELERAFQQNGLVPLQPLSPRRTPLPPSPTISMDDLPVTVPSSPLETSPSAHSFGETLRSYDQEFLERDQAFARRDVLRSDIARAMAGDH